ncbi:hypothetical protein TWF481_006198 [Arthrobotrys musiformis]|uniref:Uncharacterized protein n=1 Tax=Arthrobotrys musiformis TaxID=47236 RepID=A0AAV9WI02_9PEZI
MAPHRTDDSLFEVDFNTLKKLAKVCREFSWKAALRSWSHIWLQKHESKALLPGHENWLAISDAFGTTNLVDDLVELLGNECSVVTNGAVTRDGYSKPVPTAHWPSKILGRLQLSNYSGSLY